MNTLWPFIRLIQLINSVCGLRRDVCIVDLVLVGVVEHCVHHVNSAVLSCVQVKTQLFLPHPVVCAVNLNLQQLPHHRQVVDHIQDQSFQLQL